MQMGCRWAADGLMVTRGADGEAETGKEHRGGGEDGRNWAKQMLIERIGSKQVKKQQKSAQIEPIIR